MTGKGAPIALLATYNVSDNVPKGTSSQAKSLLLQRFLFFLYYFFHSSILDVWRSDCAAGDNFPQHRAHFCISLHILHIVYTGVLVLGCKGFQYNVLFFVFPVTCLSRPECYIGPFYLLVASAGTCLQISVRTEIVPSPNGSRFGN